MPAEQICPHTLPIEGEAEVVVQVYPNSNADGFTEHPISSSLAKRHPYLPEQSAVVKGDDATIGYGHRSWQRIAEQLKGYPQNGFSIATINNVLEIAAVEGGNPEFGVEFGKQRIDFNVLLSEKELQKATAKVLEKVLHYQSGREWCAKIGVGKKLGEIVAKTCDTKDPEERKILYAIGKACNRWATSRDDSVSGQGVVTAIVALLSNFSQRCWTDAGNNGSSPVESVDWLLILEFYTALKYMSTYVPEPVIASELLGRTVRLLEFVHASKDVPNRDAVREACLGVLTQAGNLDGGRTKLLAAGAEKIASRLSFESTSLAVQNAATGCCAVISLHKDGKAAIENFLVPDHLPKQVENMAAANTAMKTKYIQSASSKPSFRDSFIREAIRQGRTRLLEEVYGASTIPTAYRLLDEMPAEVLETLKFFLGKKNEPEGDPDSQYVAARYGCPVDSPASVAYEQLRAE
eukprot:CAMPEP_0178989050 /NCGR_PEP_ID=MMETSP0795-20121207/4141_1 /TAXON_ID=88552 /ORGANISM="Amoebophrya sp., Strain Ameob2" /LENGTH=463 /DNA_ID=CAMNT_0020680373 /DNA_START=97 /DNA_END=1488 /DNA_ORIENTATION=+